MTGVPNLASAGPASARRRLPVPRLPFAGGRNRGREAGAAAGPVERGGDYLVPAEAEVAVATGAGFTGAAVRVVRTFGRAHITMPENPPPGSGCLTSIPDSNLHIAGGLVAGVHVTGARPAASTAPSARRPALASRGALHEYRP